MQAQLFEIGIKPVMRAMKTTPANTSAFRKSVASLRTRIEFCLQPRQENTRKRRSEAEGFRHEAERLERHAARMERLADALDAGTAPAVLENVRTRAQVEMINGYEPERAHYQPDLAAFARLGLDTHEKRLKAKQQLDSYAVVEISNEELTRRMLVTARSEIASHRIPGFFRSPQPVITILLDAADINPGHKILEPEAGDGAIAQAMRERLARYGLPNAPIDCCEIQPRLREVLELQNFNLVGTDFLSLRGQYDRIVGNPPFEKLQDIDHVRHGYECLAKAGRLVMVMSPSPFFRNDKKATEFRDWLAQVGGEVFDFPPGSFKASGTGVSSKYVVIKK